MLVDVLTSLQWFNPAIWMLRSDLRAIHEYEADAAVLSSGVDARESHAGMGTWQAGGQYKVNEQGRTETWYNSIPRYAMVTIAWRFNHNPKNIETGFY